METEVTPPVKVHGLTERIHVKCTEEEGNALLRKLELGYIRATKSKEVHDGLFVIELPAPMKLTEVELVNAILSASTHEFSAQ
jgi:hypothetical protein